MVSGKSEYSTELRYGMLVARIHRRDITGGIFAEIRCFNVAGGEC
jgi:hypothetical protein